MKIKNKNPLLGVEIENESLLDILEKILIFIKNPRGFLHIVSLNPEIFLLLEKDHAFKKVVTEAQIRIIDGTYVFLTAKVLGIPVQARIQGVDLMQKLIEVSERERLRVMLIGGGSEIAERVVVCQKRVYPRLEIVGLQGIKNVGDPTQAEDDHIFSIVADVKPHFVFVAFGSPAQELWIYKHRKKFERMVVMGVGGAFDFLSGNVPRAPRWVRKLGMEWFYRLVRQPWRWRRQIKIVHFFASVFKERIRLFLATYFETNS